MTTRAHTKRLPEIARAAKRPREGTSFDDRAKLVIEHIPVDGGKGLTIGAIAKLQYWGARYHLPMPPSTERDSERRGVSIHSISVPEERHRDVVLDHRRWSGIGHCIDQNIKCIRHWTDEEIDEMNREVVRRNTKERCEIIGGLVLVLFVYIFAPISIFYVISKSIA